MLKRLSDAVRDCLALAAGAKARADKTGDPADRADFLKQETRWLTLARSFEFTERLRDFTAANAEQRRRFEKVFRDKAEPDRPPPDDSGYRSWLASIVEFSETR